MYGSAKEYAAENATLKKCETVLIPLFLLDGMIDIEYSILFAHKQNIEGVTT